MITRRTLAGAALALGLFGGAAHADEPGRRTIRS